VQGRCSGSCRCCGPVLRTAIDVARLLHRIRVIRPDVMYVKTVRIPLWIIAARPARKPVVVHVH
jgi:hypothetical protein